MRWYHDFLYVFGTHFEALLNEMKVVILGSTEEWDILHLSCLQNMHPRIFITITIELCVNYFPKLRVETRYNLLYFFKKDIGSN